MKHISLTEEAILNPKYFDCAYHPNPGWRRFRVEYGFECSCPEGVIYLPPDVDPDDIEAFLQIAFNP
jgi:hypothetical protein